jgi:dihydropyrimidinase
MLSQKEKGLADFRKIPNGAGGVEHRLALLYTYGVLEKRITVNQLVDITATQPAKIFGLFPAKGTIEIGSDADLMVWNPDVRTIISSQTHHQNSDINIYENRETSGKAEYVILNGNLIIQNGEMAEPVTKGRFLKRKL